MVARPSTTEDHGFSVQCRLLRCAAGIRLATPLMVDVRRRPNMLPRWAKAARPIRQSAATFRPTRLAAGAATRLVAHRPRCASAPARLVAEADGSVRTVAARVGGSHAAAGATSAGLAYTIGIRPVLPAFRFATSGGTGGPLGGQGEPQRGGHCGLGHACGGRVGIPARHGHCVPSLRLG